MEKRTIKSDKSPALRILGGISAGWCNHMINFIFITLICFIGCEREVIVPLHLRGEWTTSAPAYADRSMKFSEHALIYGIGDGEYVTHAIDKINSNQGDGGTVYTFYYKAAEGQKENLTVTYRPDSGGTLQIKNSAEIWSKTVSGNGG